MGSEMDQDLALRLFDEGAIFVFLDVPVGTEFGIDMNTWNVGEKFKGVKMIPPGLHFVYYSSVSKEGSTAPRTGFFHFFEKGEVLARFYNPFDEDISDRRATDEEIERFKANKKDMDRFLGAYPYESWKQWVSLTNHVTREVLEKTQPICGSVASASQLVPKEEEEKEGSSSDAQTEAPRKKHRGCGAATREEDLLPHLICVPGTEIRWTEWPSKHYPEGSTPQEISRHSLDASYQLETLAGPGTSGWHDVLGELQFAFVCFLVAQVYEGFERWKKLINVICRSEKAIGDHPGFFLDFMTVLHFQIKLVPEDFFADIVSNNNFLVDSLRRFFPNIEDAGRGEDDPLVKRAKKFKEHLKDKFEWDFEEEPEDELPVVVET